MAEIEYKELYRIPMTGELCKYMFELGRLRQERADVAEQINAIKVSDKVKLDFLLSYNCEWSVRNNKVLKALKETAGIDENLVMSCDIEACEIAITDVNKQEFDRIHRENNYRVKYKKIE